jgi:hypothetical protein
LEKDGRERLRRGARIQSERRKKKKKVGVCSQLIKW